MSNMSYCRFENTHDDLIDCLEALDEDGIEGCEHISGQYEKPYIRKLIKLCIRIADNYQDELNESEEENGQRTDKKIL